MSFYAKNQQGLIEAIEKGTHVDCFANSYSDIEIEFIHPVVAKVNDIYRLVVNREVCLPAHRARKSQEVFDYEIIDELLDEMVKWKPVTAWIIASQEQMGNYHDFVETILGTDA